MNRFLSQKFRFYSFICMALLLFVHGYNLQEPYLAPFSLVKERMTFTTFIEYLFSNGLLRFRIPLLFIISGYIFALQDHKPYGERIKKRARTLIAPYFIWSAFGILVTILFEQFAVTSQAVQQAHLDQLGNPTPYSQMHWSQLLDRWAIHPIAFQLWFIRSLFVYNLLYPVFRWIVTKYPAVWFAIAFLLWLTIFNILFFEGQGLFFFTLGIWLQKKNFRIDRKPKWFSYYLSWLFFVGLCIIKTFMAFEFEEYSLTTVHIISILHVVSVIAGVIAVWYSCDPIVKWCMNKNWFLWIAAFSFVIYGLHIPLLAYVTRLFYMYINDWPNYRLITYIFAPVLVLAVCIGFGALLRATLPKVYRLATGGRGF